MKRHVMLGTVFSAALAVGVSAQSAGQSPTSQSPTTQSPTSQSPTAQQDTDRSSNARTITVTGCLKPDTSASSTTSPGAPPNPAGSPTASASSTSYILTEMSGSGAASNPASPTESPSPTATTGSAAKTYKLTGSTTDFASLVGKKVEVKGTLQSRSGSSSSTANESRPGSMSDTSNAQQLRVTSIQEASGGGSCSPDGR